MAKQYPQTLELASRHGEEAYRKRREQLQWRAELSKAMGFRTIFHFGAPYNMHSKFMGTEPNCIQDATTARRYELLLDRFAKDFPGVDDLLVYTYDQDAWQCSEFGRCPRCAAVPLHMRLPQFVDRLAAKWHKLRPQGRLWWEPWELSAGESYECLERVNPEGLGLAIHVTIGEVMATFTVDRWVKNTAALAAQRSVPVMVEYFLGSTSEEIEPLMLAHPLVTLRGLKAIASVPGVVGVKEYFGLAPGREDPNLRMTGLFLANPRISEPDALRQLAAPYGQAAEGIQEYWRLCSSAMEFFPWDASWPLRWFGGRSTSHSLATEFKFPLLEPLTPAWASSRLTSYLRTTIRVEHDNPWLLEDVQLRLQIAAERWWQAETVGRKLAPRLPGELEDSFGQFLMNTGRIRRRAMGMAYYLRETNLARLMRDNAARPEVAERARKELLAVLEADRENFHQELAQTPLSPTGLKQSAQWPEIDAAIELLQRSPQSFVASFLK